MNKRRGFTLVELVVVIAVIGLLAAIVVLGLTRYQADTRDARRASSVTVIAEALEKYYDSHGEYPSCGDLQTDGTTAAATLSGINAATLVAPQAIEGTTNSLACTTLTTASVDFFEYAGDGSDACASNGSCLQYTLKYKEEATGTIKELASRHSTSIATSGAATLSLTQADFDNLTLSWTAVTNASSYLLQRSASASFTSPTDIPINSTATSTVVGSLSPATTYYFRVRPNATSSTGNWSNTVTAQTLSIGNPVCSAVADSNSQITVTWGAVTNATSYQFRYSTNSGMTSPIITTGITGTSKVLSGLSTGVTYYAQVKAVNSSFSSDWSTICSATTVVPVPQNLVATTASSTQIDTSWDTVSVAQSYRLEYSTTSDFSGTVTPITGIATNSSNVTGLTQGKKYYFRVYAVVDSTSSLASNTANATTTVNTPGAPGIAAYRPGAVYNCGSSYWIIGCSSGNYYYAYGTITSYSCPSGTSPRFQFEAHYNSPTTAHYAGPSTAQTWYAVQPTSGYKIKFQARYYCQGSDTNGSYGGWNASCAANPGSTVGCTF